MDIQFKMDRNINSVSK